MISTRLASALWYSSDLEQLLGLTYIRAHYKVVRFPNCHECQLGFQCPKKWEIWKQWPILEENSIAAATYWDKLTSYMSQKAISATKKSPTITVAQLEDPTCHPPNPHFGWRPFSTVGFVQKVKLYLRKKIFKFPPNPHFGWRPFSHTGFVHKVKLYLREQLFQFITRAILIFSRKQLRLHHTCGPAATDAKSLCSLRHHRIWFIALSFTLNQPRQLKFSVHVPVNHSTIFYILWAN